MFLSTPMNRTLMEVIIALIIISVISGAIAGLGGSSGFIPIVGLITLTTLTSKQISGTIATSFFIAALFGTYLYTVSGDQDKKLLLKIAPFGLVGTQIGVYVNSFINELLFSTITAIVAIFLGSVLLKTTILPSEEPYRIDRDSILSKVFMAALGVGVGIIAGVTGIGGIPIIVPALLIVGIDHLKAIATGFAVATFNTFITSISYISQGSVEFEYVLYIGVPFAIAQIVGWKISRKIKIDHLQTGLGIFNIILGLYLIYSAFF